MRSLKPEDYLPLINNALAEDLGGGDATTLAIVPEETVITAFLITREKCVCAGLPVAQAVFQQLSSECRFKPEVKDGDLCSPHQVLAGIQGPARAILSGERTALNFLQRMSGIATCARSYVQALGDNLRTRILDTRKTTPGLRRLEKYAVAAGGADNHRFGLFDRIMIKDNHRYLSALEGPDAILRSVQACRRAYPELQIEVEADTLAEVEQAIQAKADYILLDNMSDEEIAEAVEMSEGRIPLEASGNITLERVHRLAAIGVDFISVGALTHSVKATDLALDINTLD